jgi:hypothetical protein
MAGDIEGIFFTAKIPLFNDFLTYLSNIVCFYVFENKYRCSMPIISSTVPLFNPASE